MAQTRAGAKALRNVLSWVAVLAGYRPTPAEEIIDTELATERSASTNGGEPLITEKQVKLVYARWKAKGIPDDEVKTYLLKTYAIEHTKEIKAIHLDAILKWIEEYKK